MVRMSFAIIQYHEPDGRSKGHNTIWQKTAVCLKYKMYLFFQSSSSGSYFKASLFVFYLFWRRCYVIEKSTHAILHFPTGSFHFASRVSSIKHQSQYSHAVSKLGYCHFRIKKTNSFYCFKFLLTLFPPTQLSRNREGWMWDNTRVAPLTSNRVTVHWLGTRDGDWKWPSTPHRPLWLTRLHR